MWCTQTVPTQGRSQSELGRTQGVPEQVGIDLDTPYRSWDKHKEAKPKLGQSHTIPTWDGTVPTYAQSQSKLELKEESTEVIEQQAKVEDSRSQEHNQTQEVEAEWEVETKLEVE